jgi:deoxyribodipyrimidine photo-lyase
MYITIFWFRRDLRILDNKGLFEALSHNYTVLPLFIFDENIINELPEDDPRISFIYDCLKNLNQKFKLVNSSLLCLKGKPFDVWKKLIREYRIKKVYTNRDYEPYARNRDEQIKDLLADSGIEFLSYKDQVINEEFDVLKKDSTPYTVFTPYKKKWLEIKTSTKPNKVILLENLIQSRHKLPSLESIGFVRSLVKVKPFNLEKTTEYAQKRDFPGQNGTTLLGPHLRFGTISIRQIISNNHCKRDTFLNELIWREFFMQILFHFPHVVTKNFKSKYDNIQWLNNQNDYEKWCNGQTGYPLVDAGMRQLNATGYLHNRVRMVTAGFLCKHLLIDWRMGEAYFAKKLLDYELSSNNGNWQWAAGTGCDAAPYFRIFNPTAQQKKFDRTNEYIQKYIPELNTKKYPLPMVEHKYARKRALETYFRALNN